MTQGQPGSISPQQSTDDITASPSEQPDEDSPQQSTGEIPGGSPDAPDLSHGVTDDVRLAVKRHFAWVRSLQHIGERLFHYFFVGCVSLLALCVTFLIPAMILVSVAALLGIPGYLCYRWFSAPGEYFSPITVIVTIFWTGYFVTHGWPRLRDVLATSFARMQPLFLWSRSLLERIAEPDDAD